MTAAEAVGPQSGPDEPDGRSCPHVLTNTGEPIGAEEGGAAWRLEIADRDLDANLITLPPGDGIATHEGPDLDVLVHVVAGAGRLDTTAGPVDLAPGALVWLPRHSSRGFAAGPNGLRYLTVHRRRQALTLGPTTGRNQH